MDIECGGLIRQFTSTDCHGRSLFENDVFNIGNRGVRTEVVELDIE